MQNDTEIEIEDNFCEVQQQTKLAATEIKSFANPDNALSFVTELTGFIDRAKAKALETKRIQDELESKQAQVIETQAGIQQLSDSLPALAQAVNVALSKYEELRYDHNEKEFQIATLATRLSMRRAELTELRRQLAELKSQERN
jgi:uncharacterized protein involved in exopolysaccharide biosynthesis